MSDLIEHATKAIDLFDAICNIHDPSVSAHDRRVRAMAKVLESAPSPSPAPGVVTDEMVSAGHAGLEEYRRLYVSKTEVRAILTAALASLSQPAKGEWEGGE